MNEINVLEILGKNMHDIRFEKNISIQELAQKVNIDIEILKNFESGGFSSITLKQYVEIANVLGVNIKELTKGIEFTDD